MSNTFLFQSLKQPTLTEDCQKNKPVGRGKKIATTFCRILIHEIPLVRSYILNLG